MVHMVYNGVCKEAPSCTGRRHDVYGSSLPIEMEELEAMAAKRMNEKKRS